MSVIIIVVRVGVRILALLVLGTLASVACSSLLVVAVISFLDLDLLFPPAKILSRCHHGEVTSWGPRRGIDRRKSLPQISPPQTCSNFFFFLSYIHYGGHFVHFSHPVRHHWRSPMRLWYNPYAQACTRRVQATMSTFSDAGVVIVSQQKK